MVRSSRQTAEIRKKDRKIRAESGIERQDKGIERGKLGRKETNTV